MIIKYWAKHLGFTRIEIALLKGLLHSPTQWTMAIYGPIHTLADNLKDWTGLN